MATSKDTSTSKWQRDYSKIPPIPSTVWTNPLHFIAFGFGAGCFPMAPGTFGTLMAIPFYLVMRPLSLTSYFALLILIIVGSMWVCQKVSHDVGVEDHQAMCLDEIVGFLVTMFAAPHHWVWIVLGFVLFRLFDILKPWPIRLIDNQLKGGVGMIMDDVMAGIFSCVLIQIFARIF